MRCLCGRPDLPAIAPQRAHKHKRIICRDQICHISLIYYTILHYEHRRSLSRPFRGCCCLEAAVADGLQIQTSPCTRTAVVPPSMKHHRPAPSLDNSPISRTRSSHSSRTVFRKAVISSSFSRTIVLRLSTRCSMVSIRLADTPGVSGRASVAGVYNRYTE